MKPPALRLRPIYRPTYIYKTNGITVIGNSDEYEFVDALGSGTKRFRPSADGGCNIGELARRFGISQGNV